MGSLRSTHPTNYAEIRGRGGSVRPRRAAAIGAIVRIRDARALARRVMNT